MDKLRLPVNIPSPVKVDVSAESIRYSHRTNQPNHPNQYEYTVMQHPQQFDVIVVGGGHAGTEAALVAARMGQRTMLVTHSIETIGAMSCNPAIGGIGKGHIVREIDALGGVMARAADRAGIHFRRLNARKGPAVRATRAQADRALYRSAIREMVDHQKNLTLFQSAVSDLLIESDRVAGVVTQMGVVIRAEAVVLTTGTFLGGKIHTGETSSSGGRAGDAPSNSLAGRLRSLPFRIERLKTGTPPRIDGRTVDYEILEEQPGDDPRPVFSFTGSRDDHPAQVSCYITHTNEQTHAIIQSGLDRSPMYSGVIEGVGPRYCPSVEDKVVRFPERNSHQIFVEPEGLGTSEIYPNGISTSLPFDVQWKLVRSIRGFEQALITRPGYAIEYDFLDPRDLEPTLQSRLIPGLFLAGQINGTTGYEEAAGQGLLAGINAARQVAGLPNWWPKRSEAYIGVMVDDLVNRGVTEPYRMFTSRAEYRLLLREDNADVRLTPQGRELGIVDDERWRAFENRQAAVERETERLGSVWVQGGDVSAETVLGQPLRRETRAIDLLARPELGYRDIVAIDCVGEAPSRLDDGIGEQIEIEVGYAGYVERQNQEIERQQRHETTELPNNLDYKAVRGLSTEVCQLLDRQRPMTIGQASRLPGMTPAAISLLLVHLKRQSAA